MCSQTILLASVVFCFCVVRILIRNCLGEGHRTKYTTPYHFISFIIYLRLIGEFSQSDSLLTHVLGGIIVAEPCICWESRYDVWTLVSATYSFSHANILTVLVILHVALCCIRPVVLHLLHYDAIGRYRLCRAYYIINVHFYKFER